MKKNGEVNIVEKLNTYYIHAQNVSKLNKRIGFIIYKYIINQNEKEFTTKIENLNLDMNLKKIEISSICSYSEYSEFIGKIFQKVDKEEKKGDFTIETACVFSLIVDLINLIYLWKPLDDEEEWKKLSNNS